MEPFHLDPVDEGLGEEHAELRSVGVSPDMLRLCAKCWMSEGCACACFCSMAFFAGDCVGRRGWLGCTW